MILQSIKMAWKSITTNRMRSFLTMLGIIIGVFSLVVLVSLVSGATDSVTDSISSLGTDMMTVMVTDDKGNPMKIDDVADLTEEAEIGAAAPVAQSSVTAKSTYAEETAAVYGTTADYYRIQGLELYLGRFIKGVDVENHSNVVVINAGLATEVMGRMDVVGESISLNSIRYTIIGVLAEDDSDTSSFQSYEAYIPYTSLLRLADGVSSEITTFYVAADAETDIDTAEAKLEEILLTRFENDEDAYTIINTSLISDALESVTGILSLLLGGIAAISLLVGGIGIMNIMLVSVTERTREIGIRKAVGATRGTIMLQFLIEALMISLMGCLIGILVSWIALLIIGRIGDVSYGLSPGVVGVAVGFSVAVGVAFGIYPANRAAKKPPIDALRYTG